MENYMIFILDKRTGIIKHINNIQQPKLNVKNKNKIIMHYFKYEHKVEMIPYIELEILQYLKSLEIDLPNLSDDKKIIIHSLLNKKMKKIQDFYQDFFVDFRAPLILRSRKAIQDFLVVHADAFPKKLIQAGSYRNGQLVLGERGPIKDGESIEEIKKLKKDKQKPQVVSRVSQYLSKTSNTEKQKQSEKEKSKQGQNRKKEQKKKIESPQTSKTIEQLRQKMGVQSPKQAKNGAQRSHQNEMSSKRKKIESPQKQGRQKQKKLKQGIKKPTKQEYINYLRNKQKQ